VTIYDAPPPPPRGVLVHDEEFDSDVEYLMVEERLHGVERRLRRLTIAVAILVVAVVGVGVAAIVAVETYDPLLHVTAGLPSATSSGGTTAALPAPPAVLAVHPAAGPGVGGNEVSINGLDFTASAIVHFGDAAATLVSVNGSGTQLVVVVPSGSAGTVDVTVSTNWGTSSISAATRYTYLEPLVTDVRPLSVSGGGAVTLRGSDLLGATSVTFGGVPALSFTVETNGTRIVAIAPHGLTGSVPIVVTTPAGESLPATITITSP
jgi:hypothetical protein